MVNIPQELILPGVEPEPRVVVRLEQGAYRAGETLTGIAEVRIGPEDLRVRRITAKLVEDRDGDIVHAEATLFPGGRLAAGSVFTEVFELPVPIGCSPESFWTADVDIDEQDEEATLESGEDDLDESTWGGFAEFEYVPVGTPGLGLVTEDSFAGWGEPIRGSVRVLAGAQELALQYVRVYLDEWDDETPVAVTQAELATDLVVPANGEHRFRFEITAPRTESLPLTWGLFADGETPEFDEVHSSAGIDVHPPASARSLATALIRSAPVQPEPKLSVDERGAVVMAFAPDEAGSKTLDGVKLTVMETAEQVSALLEIDPQEHSFADVIRDLLKRDRVRHELRLSRTETALDEAGQPSPAIQSVLDGLLAPYRVTQA